MHHNVHHTTAVQAVVGTESIESYLKALRPKQLEEYYAAFEGKDAAHAQPKQTTAKDKHNDKETSQGGVHHSTPDHHKNGNDVMWCDVMLCGCDVM